MIPGPDHELERMALDCFQQLLASYGVAGRIIDAPPYPRADSCGVVDFVGPGIQGNLAFYTSGGLLEQMRRHGHVCGGDWVGELANQALGRLKLCLLRRGLGIAIGLPRVLTGVNLGATLRADMPLRWFATVRGAAGLCLTVNSEASLRLDHPTKVAVELREGEMVLF